MALPAGVQKLGEFKGAKGDTGSLAFATAETVPWSEGADVQMVGPQSARGAHFKIPMALPTPETVNNDEATAALILSLTKTLAALESLVMRVENVYEESDIASAIARIVARGSGVLAFPHRANILLTQTINLPDEVRRVRVDGRLTMTANVPIFNRAGSVSGAFTPITTTPTAGSREIIATHTDLAVRDWIFLASIDTLPGTSDKLGYLRQVRSLEPGKLTLDVPVPRSMPNGTNRRLRKIRMAPSILFEGDGEMMYEAPENKTVQMVTMTFVEGVFMRGIFAHDGGATGVSIRHCAKVDIDMRIERMIDDLPNGHIGYGVSVGGACREVLIRGNYANCRHAVTTNVGPGEDVLPEFPFYGEPENFVFAPITNFCSDKAVDTHRAGFGGRIIANDSGSGGVVQVRCDAVYVEVRATGNFFGDIVTVAPDLVGTTVIGPVVTSFATAAVIRAYSAVMLTAFPTVYGGNPTMFAIAAGVSIEMPFPAQYAAASGHQSFSSATTAAINGMVAYLAVLGQYVLTAHVIYRAAAAVDGKLAWSYPPGATINWTAEGLDPSTTSSQGTVSRASLAADSEGVFGAVAAGTENVVSLTARVVNGTTAGPLQLKAGQRVETAGSPLEIRAGSFMKLERVR